MITFKNKSMLHGSIIVSTSLFLLSACDRQADTENTTSTTMTTETTEAVTTTTLEAATAMGDAGITTKVKSALLMEADIKSFDINVETRNGEVILSGFVNSQDQIDRAIAIAKGIEGVKNVDSKLALKGGSSTTGEKIDDTVITARVKSALLADAAVKGLDISVVTNKGVVQLTGFVDNAAQVSRAAEVAKGAEGVQKVMNELTVKTK